MRITVLAFVLLASFAAAFAGVRVSFESGRAQAAEVAAAVSPAPSATSATETSAAAPGVVVNVNEAAPAAIVPPPDPLEDPAGFYERMRKGGGWVVVVLLCLYGALLAASKRIPRLQQGRTAAIIAGSVAMLLSLLDAAQRGTPGLSAVVVAATAGFALWLKTDAKPAEPAKAPTP